MKNAINKSIEKNILPNWRSHHFIERLVLDELSEYSSKSKAVEKTRPFEV